MTGTATFRTLVGGLAIGLVCVGCGTSHGPAGGAPRQRASTRAGAGSAAGTGSSSGRGAAGSSSGSATASSGAGGTGSSSAASGAFGWFAAKPPPHQWHLARIPAGAVLPYPSSWSRLRGDPGTATAALRTTNGTYLGYLNLTPRQGEETLANWRSFRIEHNREEGDRNVKELAVAESLHFRSGHGNCVKDSYVGGTGDPYVEIACLIAGPRGSVVAVGAAPPTAWPHQAAVIERAIEGVEA